MGSIYERCAFPICPWCDYAEPEADADMYDEPGYYVCDCQGCGKQFGMKVELTYTTEKMEDV
jgi:hypothetical protein